MILSFGDKQTEDLWIDEKSKRYGNIARVGLRKLLQCMPRRSWAISLCLNPHQ